MTEPNSKSVQKLHPTETREIVANESSIQFFDPDDFMNLPDMATKSLNLVIGPPKEILRDYFGFKSNDSIPEEARTNKEMAFILPKRLWRHHAEKTGDDKKEHHHGDQSKKDDIDSHVVVVRDGIAEKPPIEIQKPRKSFQKQKSKVKRPKTQTSPPIVPLEEDADITPSSARIQYRGVHLLDPNLESEHHQTNVKLKNIVDKHDDHVIKLKEYERQPYTDFPLHFERRQFTAEKKEEHDAKLKQSRLLKKIREIKNVPEIELYDGMSETHLIGLDFRTKDDYVKNLNETNGGPIKTKTVERGQQTEPQVEKNTPVEKNDSQKKISDSAEFVTPEQKIEVKPPKGTTPAEIESSSTSSSSEGIHITPSASSLDLRLSDIFDQQQAQIYMDKEYANPKYPLPESEGKLGFPWMKVWNTARRISSEYLGGPKHKFAFTGDNKKLRKNEKLGGNSPDLKIKMEKQKRNTIDLDMKMGEEGLSSAFKRHKQKTTKKISKKT